MINKSIWSKGIKFKKGNVLHRDIFTDVLIIGAGMTGMTTAYFLKDENLKVTLIDQLSIGMGQTSNSTGKLTYLQGNILNNIENIYDKEIVLKYIKSQIEAIDIVKDIIIENNIKCDFESNNSYVFINKKENKYQLDNLEQILKYGNISFKRLSSIPIKFPCSSSIKVNDTAVFNPVKYLLGIKSVLENSNVSIYENSKVENLEYVDGKYIITSNNHRIIAKKVVLACHYPFFNIPYLFPFKTSLKKAYLCACATPKTKSFNAISEEDNIHSIRYHSDSKNYIVYAGEERFIGKNTDNEKKYENLFLKVKKNIGEDVKYYWSDYDIVTSDYLPIIGYIEKDNKNLLIGTGYNLWGMTNGTIAGKILSDLILEKENIYTDLFDPNRLFNINKLQNYLSYNFKNGMSYILSKVNKKPKFYKNVEIRSENGKTYGVYIDNDGKEHIVSNICPHMKCNLIFNEVEKTWDCPCHGSRFNMDGKVIKGPSTYDISVSIEKYNK